MDKNFYKITIIPHNLYEYFVGVNTKSSQYPFNNEMFLSLASTDGQGFREET